VALASLILYPGLADPETGYIRVMIDYLPSSLRGLMVAAFAAAFMSTIATQLNWGASYLVNDFYRRFVRRDASEAHYVTASWLAVTFLTRPESEQILVAFYRRTRPSRAGWGPVAALAPDVRPSADGLANLVDWVAGCALVYGVLFGSGKLLLHETLPGVVLLG